MRMRRTPSLLYMAMDMDMHMDMDMDVYVCIRPCSTFLLCIILRAVSLPASARVACPVRGSHGLEKLRTMVASRGEHRAPALVSHLGVALYSRTRTKLKNSLLRPATGHVTDARRPTGQRGAVPKKSAACRAVE